MSKPPGDRDRMRRARRVRTTWRTEEESDAPRPGQTSEEADHERDTRALDANDRIRSEAPDDLETRRRADQIEREIRRADRPRDEG